MTLETGQSASFSADVDMARTAASLSYETGPKLPRVFRTPFMVADMERACAELLRPLLDEGDVCVGVQVDVRHQAPTPVGARVTSTATFSEQDGKLFWFTVKTEDASGIVGEGRIARAIVKEKTLRDIAEDRQ